jgi:hypothetical protein
MMRWFWIDFEALVREGIVIVELFVIPNVWIV